MAEFRDTVNIQPGTRIKKSLTGLQEAIRTSLVKDDMNSFTEFESKILANDLSVTVAGRTVPLRSVDGIWLEASRAVKIERFKEFSLNLNGGGTNNPSDIALEPQVFPTIWANKVHNKEPLEPLEDNKATILKSSVGGTLFSRGIRVVRITEHVEIGANPFATVAFDMHGRINNAEFQRYGETIKKHQAMFHIGKFIVQNPGAANQKFIGQWAFDIAADYSEFNGFRRAVQVQDEFNKVQVYAILAATETSFQTLPS